MKLVQLLVLEKKNEKKVKKLIDLYDDELTDWDFRDKTYEVVDPYTLKTLKIKVWTCLGTNETFLRFSKAYAAIVDGNASFVDITKDAKKID